MSVHQKSVQSLSKIYKELVCNSASAKKADFLNGQGDLKGAFLK